MLEKRQYKRFQIPLPITIAGMDEPETSEQQSRLMDISIGGARFNLNSDVEIGEEFEIRLEDTESNFASALGLVTDSSGPLSFKMHAKVLRANSQPDRNLREVAVEFCSPLRISPLAA